MKAFVTGGAGCIGSELVSRLLNEGNSVVAIDNLSSGKIEHIKEFAGDKNFSFIRGNIRNKTALTKSMKGCDIVFHFAANSNVKFTFGDPTDKDLNDNIIGTYNVLEAMRLTNVKNIAFTSTSPIYGKASVMPTPENYGPLEPISLYAASKIANEAMISAFSHMFDMRSWIFRIANTIGGKSRKTGAMVLSDFITKLKSNPKELLILGNGKQRKSYMTVEDCIDGMLFAIQKSKERVNIFNVGPSDNVSINEIAEIVAGAIGLKNVKFRYTGTTSGWLGDVPEFLLDTSKMKALGWKPKYTSKQAIRAAAKMLLANA